jgi:hypothetical protein
LGRVRDRQEKKEGGTNKIRHVVTLIDYHRGETPSKEF